MNENAIAKFEKVSFETWIAAFENGNPDGQKLNDQQIEELRVVYDNIKLPERATTGSAGYDIFLPFDTNEIMPSTGTLIPTGLKCKIEPGWVLLIVPKSGLGMRYKMRLDNTIAVIDSDYYNCELNEGHIMVAFSNELPPFTVNNPITQKAEVPKELILQLPAGKAFVQGIFVPFGVADDVEVITERTGGIGSTDA